MCMGSDATATYMHAFVIPVDLTRSMEAAVKTAMIELHEPDPLEDIIKKQSVVLDLVASIDPKLWKFSRQYVGALTAFHAVKIKARSCFEDRKWLEQDWRKVDSNVDMFGSETGTYGLSADAVRDWHRTIANEVISKFASSSLSSEFVAPSGKGHVSFDKVVGGLCRGWLNDDPVDFSMDMIYIVVGQCYVLSSLTTAVGFPTTPTSPIQDTSSTGQFEKKPLGVIIAQLQYSKTTVKLRVHAYMYEPLINEEYHSDLEIVWDGIRNDEEEAVQEGLRGFVERWHQSSAPSTKLVVDPMEWVENPQQPDYASCGVMVVAQAYAYVTGNLQWRENDVSKNDVKVMRLRMLWVILCKSHARRISRDTADKKTKIDQQLKEQPK